MFGFEELKVEAKGCEFCMSYSWELHKEIPKDLSGIVVELKQIKYCPFCGRKLNIGKNKDNEVVR